MSITLTVAEEAEGWRLDHFVAAHQDELSRSFIQKLIRGGQVTVNGRTSKPGYRLRLDERVEVRIPPPEPLDLEPEPIPLDIRYEDKFLLVINKPPGMVVHPGAGATEGTLVHALLSHCDSLSGIGGVERPGIVHRLDKDTSGLLVVAKADGAHRNLSRQLRLRTMGRRYRAIVCGVPPESRWTVESFIGRSPRNRKKMTVLSVGGRRAVTHLEVAERFERFALVTAQLETGRTHQIRVHLAHEGFPVVGDPVYGGGRRRALRIADTPILKQALSVLDRQALHAEELRFLHPETRESMAFSAPLPGDMMAVLEALRSTQTD